MPRLTLQCEDRVLKEYAVGPVATIGRLADNTIIIDSPAVSGHHACVFRNGHQFAVEDLQSTNGTFVNGTRVSRQALQDGDVVRVGKHELVLDQSADVESAAPDEAELSMPNGGETVFIDKRKLLARLMRSETAARKYDALLARLKDVETDAGRSRYATARPSISANVGVLRVLDGRADQTEYSLEAHTSLIGKGKSSLVRLRGWFKPQVAVVITRNQRGYVATLLDGDVLINSQSVSGRHELKDGDLLAVSGLVLEFHLQP
jgi:pSer/pThr/pTyr-binding forkhead associated (FHA) protein